MQTRSDFLSAGTLALLAPATVAAAPITATAAPTPATAASAGSSPSPSPEPPLPPLDFDLAAFDTALDTTATHRNLFTATKLEGAEILAAMRNTLGAYRDVRIALDDVRSVAVLYHGLSITLAFDDSIWDEYFAPAFFKGAPANAFFKDFNTVYDSKKRGNPCLHARGGHDDTSLESLVADAGARFFVCNNAAKGFARYIAGRLKLPTPTVYGRLASHLVRNASLVPAGVWAVHAVQERRYTLLQTTL